MPSQPSGDMSDSLRILLVDDDEIDRMGVQRVVRASGLTAEVVEAFDGAEAIGMLRAQAFDVVLLDFRMPGHDGLWVLREVARRGIGTPIIMLTGQGDEHTAVELMKAGAADYIAKAQLTAELLDQSVRQTLRLHLAQQQHRTLAEALPLLVFSARPDGTCDYVNRRWSEYTGLTWGETVTEGWKAICHPEDLAESLRQWDAVLQNGQPFESSSRMRRHTDGAWRWHLIRAMPLRNPHGRIIQWLGTCTDIDDQKRATEALSFLAEASTQLTASLDRAATLERLAGLIVPRLGDWCAIYLLQEDGTRPEPAMLAHADPSLTPLVRELHRRHPLPADLPFSYPRVLRTGEPELVADSVEALVRQVVGEDTPLGPLERIVPRSWVMVPLRAQRRVFGALRVCVTGTSRSYTQRDLELVQELGRRVEIALDNARLFEVAKEEHQRAEQANRAKDEFLATLSHELRTPLTAILGWTRMLRSGQLSPEKQARALETVERNAQVQTQLIEDLLDVSRIIAGKVRLDVRPVSPLGVVEAALDSVRPTAEAKGVQLYGELDAGADLISGDPDRLQQVVWNLLTNAIKFTPRGGRVSARLRRAGTGVAIEVEDTGQGIPPDFLPYVFERFRQFESGLVRKHGGLGLGLSIVRHITELHGGTIQAHSEGEGRGARFTVTLPLVTAFPEHGRTSVSPSTLDGGKSFTGMPELRGLNVLVVDDAPDAREFLTTVLETCGAQVVTAASAAEGMEQVQRFRPDAVVSDVGMPGEDGYSFIRRLRALPPAQGGQSPAIAVTAFTRMDDRARALLAGFQSHLPKPIEPSELVRVLASLTGRLPPG
ncbi:response regulator [Pyxidicoccus fallax]|uniref:histidine kinase n=1 Tax=Pyxidicoccus fallax TaxID=394095 RepID=A0A848L4N4_9BACT|nr:response regulator [Pyxidicoccus fallax]NMO13674.1 response regulator [Pyxidicoccus fallax]NPC76838.1 response regulator [Pyxidicoccus fallax]